jgi:glycosyltransferase involved in cell wall biosynthesis
MISLSVIIPSYAEAPNCFGVLEALANQTLPATEILLVRSGDWGDSVGYWDIWLHRFALRNTVFKVVYSPTRLMPGNARNFGLMFASGDLIGFLDVQTIPKRNWLENQVNLIKDWDTVGSYGSTNYIAANAEVKLVRDAIYGSFPLITIPGAVLHRSVFDIVGQFIPNVRAAEDTEWMIRAELMRLKIFKQHVKPSVDYLGLNDLSLLNIAKKWRRNYVSCRELQHLRVQRALVWLILYFLLSLLAFNWNSLIAGWQEDSPFYIGHITKIASLTPITLYIFVRGMYIPFKRGVPLNDLLPLRFFGLALVGGILDLTKVSAVAFSSSGRNSVSVE